MSSKDLIIGLVIGALIGNLAAYYLIPRETDDIHQTIIDELEERLEQLQTEKEDLQQQLSQLLAENHQLSNELLQAQGIQLDYEELQAQYQALSAELAYEQNRFIQALTEPIAPFTVHGKYVYDRMGRKVIMKGFQLDNGKYDLTGVEDDDPYTLEDLQRIKDWGFHFVYDELWWGKVERYEDQRGVYDYNYVLDDFQNGIELCEDSGLHFIFRFRVSAEDARSGQEDAWWGWPTAAYVCTPEGLTRYCDFLKSTISLLESRHDNIVVKGHPYEDVLNRCGFLDSRIDINLFYTSLVNSDELSRIKKSPASRIFFSWGDHDSLPTQSPF